MQTLHEQEPTSTVVMPVKETPLSEEAVAREHTTLPQTTGKRIVSKRRYVVNIGKKVALSSVSLGFVLVASFTLVGMLLFVSVWYSPAGHQSDFGMPEEAPPWIIGNGIVSLLCYFLAWRSLHKASKVETGVPLTRASTASLPAPDSLVRASSEPQQAQEAVLLRAAAQGQETPPEQLIRASVGPE